jgi:hypothetical protein
MHCANFPRHLCRQIARCATIPTTGHIECSALSKIREAWASSDRIDALRIAARFFERSVDTQIFKRGMDANNHPDFYRQLRQDPDQITAAALQLLARKFNLTGP